jgi:hypothetical protein
MAVWVYKCRLQTYFMHGKRGRPEQVHGNFRAQQLHSVRATLLVQCPSPAGIVDRVRA